MGVEAAPADACFWWATAVMNALIFLAGCVVVLWIFALAWVKPPRR